jgi:flagellar hook-associated protein 2
VLNSGDLHLQTVSQNTLLNSYNGGAGVAQGSFQIKDSAGDLSTIQVASGDQTIGDVINAINRGTTGVVASINATGDGVLLTDTAHGSGTLSVTEGNSTTAHDLNLLSAAATANGVQTINGTTTRTITLKAGDTLTDLESDINNLGGGLSANILTAGSSNPYRLSLTSTQSGAAGNLVVDSSGISGLSLQELAHGQDALLALGNASSSNSATSAPPVIVSSSSNTFSGVLSGASLTINSATGTPVSVTVGNDGSNIATSLQNLVTNYNSFRTQLSTDTAYNTTTNTGAVLSDDGSTLQLDVQLSQILTQSFSASGPVKSLADIGITVQSNGTLSFNQNQFESAWSSNPAAVQQFFTASKTGVSAQFDTLINQLAGPANSLLSSKAAALQSQISDNQSTISQMNQRLNDESNRLYTEFYNMDLTIGKLKNTQSVISSITSIAPDFGAVPSATTGG